VHNLHSLPVVAEKIMFGGALNKEDLNELFSGIEDPRIDRNKRYPAGEIVFLALVGALSGVESWRGLELFGNDRLEFLRKYFLYKDGICSHQTISRVFSLIAAKNFEICFIGIMASLFPKAENEIIALDGKTLRGSGDKSVGKNPLHLLNAWAVKNGVCLGQLEVGSKTNEITAVPDLIDMLDIKGATVTSDALNCQKNIAKKICEAGADYVLAVKGNQNHLYQAIIRNFEEGLSETGANFLQTVEKNHGRIETRTYQSIKVGQWLPNQEDWTNIKSIGIATSDVHKAGKDTGDTRFFICSFEPDVKRLAEAVRGHWAVENNLHWVLDVTYREDASQKRKDNAPINFSVIRKFALNLLKKDKTKGRTGPMKRIKAAINTSYLSEVLAPLTGFK
jgi:predicted transposase YbfD/YdcC